MAQERDVRNPTVRTYLREEVLRDGSTVVHTRVYSREYDADVRGTGRTPKTAVARALSKLPPARQRR